MKGYLTVRDVAQKLDIKEETVRRWLRKGLLHGTPLGRAGYRIEPAALEDYLHHRHASSAHSPPQTAIQSRETTNQNEGSEEMESSQQPRHILIVEENPEDIAIVSRYLSRSQGQRYSTHEAGTGRQALARSQDERFDCVILDYNLPDMKGADFLDALHKQSIHPYVAVVVLTGSGNETIAVQSMKRGAQDYMQKEHLSPEFLCHTIESAIESMAMQRRMEEQRQELARQHHAYQTLAENAPDIIERIDTQFRHLYANTALAKVIGMPIEAILGKTGREAGMPEGLCEQWEKHLSTIFETRQGQQFEFTFVSAEGERFYQANLVPEFDEVGKVSSVLAISRDVTNLKRTEERLRLAISGAKMGTWDWDLMTNDLIWSDELEEALGFAPGTFGRSYEAFISLVHPDDRVYVKQQIQHALKEKSEYIVEFRMYRTDGSLRWTATRAKALYDVNNRPVRMIGIDMDITERKLVLQQGLERASELEAFFEAMTDGLFILKKQGATRLNQAARELLGVPASSQGVKQAIPPFMLLDEQGQELPQAQWPETRLQRGEQLVGSDAADVRIRRYDGRETEVSITGAPLRSAEGEIDGIIMVSRDVTVRRNLERRTHEALAALIMMAEKLVTFETIPTMTGEVPMAMRHLANLTSRVLDCEGTVLVTLKKGSEAIEHIISGSFETNPGKNILSPIQKKQLSEYVPDAQMVQQLRAGKAVLLDVRNTHYHKLQFYPHQQQILLMPLRVGSELVGFIGLYPTNPQHEYAEDEIELAEAVGKLAVFVIEREHLLREREEARAHELVAREMTRQMDEFIGIISHELKTPLTSIKGNVQLAKMQVRRSLSGTGLDALSAVSKSIQETLDRAERQVNVQNRLVNDLLDVSRIRTDKLDLQLELCDLVVLVQEIIEDQMRLMPTRTIQFSSAVAEALVQADVQRIGQVVNNYLSNALKYSETSSRVEIKIEREEAFVRVTVRDEGPGLALEVQERIWERFYRAPEVRVKSGSSVGLGLGLYICRTIIERQGGFVGVKSVEGEGSTFWFTLPLMDSSNNG